jgi:hypothetical protein
VNIDFISPVNPMAFRAAAPRSRRSPPCRRRRVRGLPFPAARVRLVDPRQLKRVPGRKTDVLDCQWIQQLHTFGLLAAAFRPDDQSCVLRSYLRQRAMLVTYAAQHIQHMQKALELMNLKLAHVVSDIAGRSRLMSWRVRIVGAGCA